MAKKATKRPESKSVTLSTGTRVTGPVSAIDKLVARDRGTKRRAKATSAPAPTPAEDTKPEPSGDGGSDPSGDAPERPNRGASLASWAAFADHLGVEYPDGAGRDEIRDLVEAAHPAE